MISKREIFEKLSNHIVQVNETINPEVKTYIDGYNGPFSQALKENYKIAEAEKLPLCQDTGIVEFFVFLGNEVILEDPIFSTLSEVVEKVYTENPFRFSLVSDPLFERKNTKNNTPPVVHIFQVSGKSLEIKFLVKGGGSENLSALFMLKPSIGVQELKDVIIGHVKENGAKGCPPLHVGIGIGGTSDKAMVLSKLALTKSFKERNQNPVYADFEEALLKDLNTLKIGFQGLKKGVSVFSVHVEYAPTHIATLPVGVSLDCYLCRKGVVKFEDR
jgi:fumarate hydratase subunit alpha